MLYFVKWQRHKAAKKIKKEHQDIPIAASILAKQFKKPLFADDRVCQVLVLNDSSEDNYTAAFGHLTENQSGELNIDFSEYKNGKKLN